MRRANRAYLLSAYLLSVVVELGLLLGATAFGAGAGAEG
jgi:hypothetical protein